MCCHLCRMRACIAGLTRLVSTLTNSRFQIQPVIISDETPGIPSIDDQRLVQHSKILVSLGLDCQFDASVRRVVYM